MTDPTVVDLERLVALLRDDGDELRRANAGAPPPPAEAIDLTRAMGCPAPARNHDNQEKAS